MSGFLRRLFGKKEEPLSERDAFAAHIKLALQDQAPDIQVEYDPVEFELRRIDPQARGQRTFLYNSFVEYSRLVGKEKEDHLAKVVQFIIASSAPAPRGEDALNNLLPVLRARADLMAVATDERGFAYSRSSRPFCETMLLMLAIDSENSIGLVTDDLLDELGVSFDDALGVAIAHMDERGNHSWGQLDKGTYVSTCGDYYDASRLLIPGLVEQLPLKGNPVAIVQARSAVLVTGSEDDEGLGKIAGFALQDFPENERAVSLTPIELHEGKWRVLEIRDDHPQSLKNLRSNQSNWSYGATQQALQTMLGEDTFVATAQLYENEGRFSTIAVWSNGVRTACPLVDAIVLQNVDGSDAMLRSMENVIDVCGPLDPVTEMEYPIRWLLPAQISEESQRRLREDFPDHVLFPD